MAQVTLNQLDKVYPAQGKTPPFHAVKGIDLEIRDREFMVLVGPSGCGKSTTLRMIAGLEDITGGEIVIGDRVVNHVEPKNRDIAMVFQNYALYPHMTVFDNMAFGLKLLKVKREEISRRVTEAAEILGITELLDRKPKALSGGQRQRVAVGRAIVRNPKVFLFDEPLSNLDAKMRVSMRTEISRLHARLNATMIYVTHDQIEAMTMGDRICVMRDGIIMQLAEPIELYNNPANMFVAGFIGSPPMNFIHGSIEKRGRDLWFVEKAHEGISVEFALNAELSQRMESKTGKAVIFGVRPEDIECGGEASTDRPVIPAKVELSEPIGAETYLYCSTGLHSFIAKVESDRRFGNDVAVELAINLSKVHFFDPETEQSLTLR
jgi:multiple sugar transport system ATP-binding protein